MNKIQQYEYIRTLDDSQFEFVKDIYNRSKSAMWNTVGRIIDIVAAVGLAYVAYDAIDTLPAILAGFGTLHLLFKDRIANIFGSITGALAYRKDVEVAKDVMHNMNKMICDIQARHIEDLCNPLIEEETEAK